MIVNEDARTDARYWLKAWKDMHWKLKRMLCWQHNASRISSMPVVIFLILRCGMSGMLFYLSFCILEHFITNWPRKVYHVTVGGYLEVLVFSKYFIYLVKCEAQHLTTKRVKMCQEGRPRPYKTGRKFKFYNNPVWRSWRSTWPGRRKNNIN